MPDLSFLKKKELGLPLWVWALIVAVIMLVLYRHYRNKGANSQAPVDTTSQATPADAGVGGDLGGGSGGGSLGGAADTSGGLSDIAKELQPFSDYYQSLLDSAQGTQTDTTPPDNAGNTTPAPTASTKGLEWDGKTFTSRADFNAYLKSKGLSVKQFAARHPAAYAIYQALPTGVTKTKAAKSSVLNSAKKAAGSIRGGKSKAITPRNRERDSRTLARHTLTDGGLPHPASSRRTIVRPQTRQPVPARFYTYKSQVRLGRGQTLHYTRGRGYYA